MVICNPPIVMKMYTFMYEHLDCDCIVDFTNETDDGVVDIVAYSEGKNDNINLRTYFNNAEFANEYSIVQGIDSKGINCV